MVEPHLGRNSIDMINLNILAQSGFTDLDLIIIG